MALHDYMTGTDIEFEVTPNPLAAADIDLSEANANAERRARREEIQKKIYNLEAQKKELQDRLASVRAHSLSGMSEDEVVTLAKSRGIRDQDIETWLRGRTARTNREISQGQKEELGKQAEAEAQKAAAIEDANKQARKKAILEARNAYETANKPVELEEYESKVSELDSLEFTFKNLKDSYEKDYNEKLDYTLSPRKVKPADGAPKTEIPAIPTDIELTEDQMREWNKPTTTTDQRNKIIAQIRDKKKAEAEKKEKEEKARARKYDAMRRHLATLGINAKTKNITQIIKNAEKTQDKTIRDAVDALKEFVHSEKDFYGYNDLLKLFNVKEGK